MASNLSCSHQEIVEQLDLMLRARYPLIYLVGVEEEPIKEVLTQVCDRANRELRLWDIVRGWDDSGADKGSAIAALGRIAKASIDKSAVYVLRDLHPVLKFPLQASNVPIVREIKNLAHDLKRSRKTLILTSHSLDVPQEFIEEMTVIDFPLPDIEEIDTLISQIVVPEKLKLSQLAKEQLVKACQGLSRARIQRVLAASIAAKQHISEQDIDSVLEAKRQAIRQTGILEFFTTQESLKSVGGLDNLKNGCKCAKIASPKKQDATAFRIRKAFCLQAFKAQENHSPLKPSRMNGDCRSYGSMRGGCLVDWSEKAKAECAK